MAFARSTPLRFLSTAQALILSVVIALAAACSTSVAPGQGQGPGGSCPCDVGNSGIHYSIPCGGSACVELNGTQTGYTCSESGATVNPVVCSPGYDSGIEAPDSATGAQDGSSPPSQCVPKSCADQGFSCGTVPDTCGGMVACPACATSQYCSEDDHCLAEAQNVAIYGNLQGGTFGINVDSNVPNLAIGLLANSPMSVTISGPYSSNVVAVYVAVNNAGSTVSGVSQSLVVSHRVPKATIDAGFTNMVLDCEQPSSASSFPCNPPAQVDAFFTSTLGGSLLFNNCQQGAFTGTMNISQGGTCM